MHQLYLYIDSSTVKSKLRRVCRMKKTQEANSTYGVGTRCGTVERGLRCLEKNGWLGLVYFGFMFVLDVCSRDPGRDSYTESYAHLMSFSLIGIN